MATSRLSAALALPLVLAAAILLAGCSKGSDAPPPPPLSAWGQYVQGIFNSCYEPAFSAQFDLYADDDTIKKYLTKAPRRCAVDIHCAQHILNPQVATACGVAYSQPHPQDADDTTPKRTGADHSARRDAGAAGRAE